MPKLNRRRGIVIAIMALLLAGIAYAIYSYVSWKTYTSDYREWSRVSTKRLTESLDLPIGDNTTKSDKLSDIEKSSESVIKEAKGVCDVPVVIEWQTALKSIKDRRSDCYSTRDRLINEAKDNIQLVAYVKLEQQLVDIIATAQKISVDSSNPESWSAIQQSWQQAVENTKKIPDDNTFNSTRDLVAEQLKQIAEAWQSLVVADESQDEPQFEAARLGVEQAYQNLADSAASLSEGSPLE